MFYASLLLGYSLLGYPYHVLTLRRFGARRWDFGDYALLTLAGWRGVYRWWRGDPRGRRALVSARVRKVYLVHLVNLFFLTLMTSFLVREYASFAAALAWFASADHPRFFEQYRHGYLAAYHLLFVLDVGIAVVGYSLASRWLDNRTKTVETSLYGWLVVLVCYPPMNSGFTSKFISYGGAGAASLVTSDLGNMLLMAAIFACFAVYVWATLALGLRFSNLTNRGVVSIGPYAYLRHPAYITKNAAWWLDHTYVLTNGWWFLSLAAWTWIYLQRGITEERHLGRDPAYRAYVQRVTGRWFPRLRGMYCDAGAIHPAQSVGSGARQSVPGVRLVCCSG